MHAVVLGLVLTLTVVAAGRISADLGDDPATFDRQVEAAYVRIYVRRDAMWQLISHRTVREASGPPPASTTSGFAGAYRQGDGVTVPRVISEAKPQYTADAMRAKVQGSVLLECVVETDGTVGEVHLVRSLDRENGLDESAIRAAKQWRFAPGTRDRQPVPVIITIQMAFTLGKHH